MKRFLRCVRGMALNFFILAGVIIMSGIHAAPAGAEELKAGIGVADISPDTTKYKVPLGGYGARENKPALGIHDSTMAKALIFQQGSKKFALVTLDLLGTTRSLRDDVLKLIAGTGITSENLMFAASHSHGSLEMNTMHRGNKFQNKYIGIFDESLLDFTAKQVAEAIKKANEKFVPVKVGVASAQIPGLNRNRRAEGITDNEMTVMKVDTIDGKPFAIFVNYAAHPTFISEKTMYLTAEWPGFMQREIEAYVGGGVVAMYANGEEGDVAPNGGNGPSEFARVEDYGRKIAMKALQIIPLIKTDAGAELAYSMDELKLPPKSIPPALAEAAGPEYGLTKDNLGELLDAMQPSSSYLGIFRIGGFVGVGIPGELFSIPGLHVKEELKKAGAAHPIIIGLANEWVSYMPTVEAYRRGGYEAGVCFYGETLGTTVADQAIVAGKKLIKAN